MVAARRLAGSLLFAALAPGLAAGQVVIDFEDIQSPVTQTYASYQHAGYQLTSSLNHSQAFASWGFDDPNYAGSQALFNNFDNQVTTLSRLDAGPFDIFSIALAHVYAGQFAPTTVNFVGALAGGGNVFQSFVIPAQAGSPSFTNFAFSNDFRNLVSVSWAQTPTYHQFDDIVLERPLGEVPEPFSMVLLATGLAGLGVVGRRRSRIVEDA